jgi:ribonuclease HI
MSISPKTYRSFWLKSNEYEIMWILSHVGVRSNDRADQLAGDAVENGIEWHAYVLSFKFSPIPLKF